MKSKRILLLVSVTSLLAALPFAIKDVSFEFAEAAMSIPPTSASKSLPNSQNIDLSDTSDAEIRTYYASLSSLGEDELQSNNLLKNLKTILKKSYYYTYTNVWKIYEITDRDWTLSPASGTSYGSYDASTNQILNYEYGTSNSNGKNNPYIRTMYRDDSEAGRITAWGDHSVSGINREHLWPQSRGFSGDAKGPAGTDIHHLVAGDGSVNQHYHNNNPYGNVANPSKTGTEFLEGNKLGTSAFDGTTTVFEPADQHKGDIARAIFYMAARYNNWAGESGAISQFEPFLEIKNESYTDDTVTSSDTKSATMGILHDLLEWHEEDPVDEYEIHRNNLICNNYQANRNPFIDFPEWVTYVWGTSDNVGVSKGIANPQSDTINGYNQGGGEDPSSSSSSLPSSSEESSSTPESSEPQSSEASSSDVPSSEPSSSSSPTSEPPSSSSESPSGGFGGCFSSINGGIIASILGTIGIITIGATIIVKKSRKKEGK